MHPVRPWWLCGFWVVDVCGWILGGGSVLVVSVDIEILGGGSVWLDSGWWICVGCVGGYIDTGWCICVAGYWVVDLSGCVG